MEIRIIKELYASIIRLADGMKKVLRYQIKEKFINKKEIEKSMKT